jgi:hypothetical protein
MCQYAFNRSIPSENQIIYSDLLVESFDLIDEPSFPFHSDRAMKLWENPALSSRQVVAHSLRCSWF